MQLNVVTFVAGSHRREIPTELEALGDKTAPTIATNLEGVLCDTFEGTLPTDKNMPEVWVIHFVIGDAIDTNGAATRVLRASVPQWRGSFAQRVRYFLVVVKRMVHQVGLSAKDGVIGRAASTASGEQYKDIAGVAYVEFTVSVCVAAQRGSPHRPGTDISRDREKYWRHIGDT